MYISLVTETFDPDINGVATTLKQIHSALRASGHRVQLVCPKGDTARVLDDLVEVPGLALPFYTDVRLGLPVGRRLKRRWQIERPDLVHIATEGPLGYAALRTAKALGLPVTSSLHTNFHTYMTFYRVGWLAMPVMRYLKWFHNHTACTFIPTGQQAETLGERGFDRLAVLGRGVDTSLFNPERRDEALRAQWRQQQVGITDGDENYRVALHVGRLAPEKNLDLLVQAFSAMRAAQPALVGVVVGDGPERARLEKALPWVIFTGMKRDEPLARHYASADFFVFPSKTETFGNVLLEAMACGLSCISFDYAAGNHLINDGKNGYLVPLGDDEQFVQAAVAMAEQVSGQNARQMGSRAREVAATFDWARVTSAFEQHLKDVLQVESAKSTPEACSAVQEREALTNQDKTGV
jgi:glycosyltransferase involved in cell wall biosynthesis